MKLITLPNAHAELMKKVITFYINVHNVDDSYDRISIEEENLLLESYAEFM